MTVGVEGHGTMAGRIARMGGENMIGLNKAVRAELGVEAGDTLQVTITLDAGERVVEVPDDLAAALAAAGLADTFAALAPSHRKEYVRWVTEAKKAETRERRVAETIAASRRDRSGERHDAPRRSSLTGFDESHETCHESTRHVVGTDMDAVTRTDVVVVGAGPAGLAAARLVTRAGLTAVVVDPRAPGGRATTDDRNGFLLNRGPRGLYLHGPAERVLRSLEVPLPGRKPTGGWLLDGDEVVPLPAGPVSIARTPVLGLRGATAFGRLLGRMRRADLDRLATVTWADWLDDQALPTDTRRIVEVLGRLSTYSHALRETSADVVVSALWQAVRYGVRYVDGGWGSITDHLATGLDVRRASVTALHPDGPDVVAETTEGTVVARAAVVAVGTPAAAAALCGRAPFDVAPPVEASCLDLGLSRPSPRSLLLGMDAPLYLSDHGARARLSPAGGTVVHVARYLAPGEDPDPTATRAQLDAHAAAAGITDASVTESRYLHRMVVAGALTAAAHGGMRGRPDIADSGVSGTWLAGDWVGPTGSCSTRPWRAPSAPPQRPWRAPPGHRAARHCRRERVSSPPGLGPRPTAAIDAPSGRSLDHQMSRRDDPTARAVGAGAASPVPTAGESAGRMTDT